jgi:hypothetical protein
LSVSLIGLQLNLGRSASSSGPIHFLSRMNLAPYAYGLIVLGSFLILSGCLIEVAIPTVRWWVGWRGRLYRTLGRKIEEGRELAARSPEISFDEQKQWASMAKGILEAMRSWLCAVLDPIRSLLPNNEYRSAVIARWLPY